MEISKSDLTIVFKGLSFSNDESALLASTLKKISLPKGSVLLRETEIVKYQYYVMSGCLRTYYIDQQDKEYTLQFGIKDWWISDYTAYFSSDMALLNVECLKDVVLLRICRNDVELLYKKIPAIETFFRKKLERAFASFQCRILGALSQSAKDRYVSFIESYPNIEKSVKNYHIASYLGITTESLSRIRKEIALH